MNTFLDTAGALLYFAWSIILAPLFLALDIFLWTLIGLRWSKSFYKRVLRPRLRKGYGHFPFPWPAELSLVARRLWLARSRH